MIRSDELMVDTVCPTSSRLYSTTEGRSQEFATTAQKRGSGGRTNANFQLRRGDMHPYPPWHLATSLLPENILAYRT